jgi:hypothetical protein
MPCAWRPRPPCSRESFACATRCAHIGPSPAPCHRPSGFSLPACPDTSRHSCPPRRVGPMHPQHADLDQGAPSRASHHRPLAWNPCPHDSTPHARLPRRPCSRDSHARATQRAHNGPSPAPCHRPSGRSLACPHTSRHSCPRGARPQCTRRTRTWTGERLRRPSTIARSPPDIRST